MPDFTYPSNIKLQLVAQELVPTLTQDDPIFDDLFPIRQIESHLVEWEQRDNYRGLQQIRGLNGAPVRVAGVSGKRWQYQPGVYGEYLGIDERQMTQRRALGTLQGGISLDDLVMEAQQKLLQREVDRMRAIGWTLAATGTFTVADGPIVMHSDSYTMQTFSAGTAWSTFATSTPLADIRSVQLKGRGYSLDFGSRAKMYMNRSTANNMLSNTNASDLGGRRGAGLSSINGVSQFNELMMMDDLPQAVIYDRGYYDDAGNFNLFIPNNKVIVIGDRTDNDPVGAYLQTLNVNNPGFAPGPYNFVLNEDDWVPKHVEVHRGQNGGPALYHPAAVVVMSV